MRRLIFPSSLFCLAALLCVSALPSTAGAARSAAHIACPETQQTCCPTPVNGAQSAPNRARTNSAASIPCCAYPTTGTCCPTPTNGTCCTSGTPCCTTTCCTACTPTGLTIAASPDPSTAGRKVVISGGLTSNPVAGATVALWRKLSGQSSFHQVTQTTTDSAGQYKITMKAGSVNADQQWYVTGDGLQSPTVSQTVNALVGLSPSSRSVAAGSPLVLKGRVTPSHAGQIVLIEQSRGGSWAVIARPRLGHSSTYTMSHRFTHAGAVKLRAVLQADARNNRSNSPTVTVTVK